ncbi:MAG: hypothetical protein HZA52_18855 [Planctomycetes bacterium]|nr:hypothetical protein [Planctomycetota bacterium]
MDLAELRRSITSEQRRLLDEVWGHLVQHDKWPIARKLYAESTPSEVRRVATSLGGSVLCIHERQGADLEKVSLTALGILLTSEGERLEGLLGRYLAYVADRVRAQHDLREVASVEVGAALDLSADDLRRLGRLLLDVSARWNAGGNRTEAEWCVGVPYDIDEIGEYADPAAFVRDEVMVKYDPEYPIDAIKRLSHSARVTTRVADPEPFAFVADAALRAVIASDFAEAERVNSVSASKSCLVLCGAVIEGLLIDALEGHATRAGTEDDFRRLGLDALLKRAQAAGLLKAANFHLSQALREYRNLVHPARQLRDGVRVDEGQARLALEVVRQLIGERIAGLPAASVSDA